MGCLGAFFGPDLLQSSQVSCVAVQTTQTPQSITGLPAEFGAKTASSWLRSCDKASCT